MVRGRERVSRVQGWLAVLRGVAASQNLACSRVLVVAYFHLAAYQPFLHFFLAQDPFACVKFLLLHSYPLSATPTHKSHLLA